VEKARLAYLPLDKYDVDLDLTRSFPAEICRRWCVLPFDRMSKTVLSPPSIRSTARPRRNSRTPPRTACSGTSRHRLKSWSTCAGFPLNHFSMPPVVKSFGERIADALVEDGLLTTKQVDELLEQQRRKAPAS